MQQQKIFICFIFILTSIHASILTNQCFNSSLCNCTLINNTNLEIVCDSTLSLSTLPTLNNTELQTNVTYLHVSSSIAGTSGPLITLPTNICSSYPNIAILNLSSNSITGLLNTSELACLGSNLINVDFSNNFINNIDINFFKSNRKLQTINFSHNNLTTMPTIDAQYFINFTSTITLMNFSYNQIISVDLWPIFVKTQNFMTIDMSHNLITNYTNIVPVYVKQFTATPDPRTFYLNNNQLTHLSDLVVEQYGACSTLSEISTAYFVVGISNILLTNNPLICDCESYNLMTFINGRITDFPLLTNGSALLIQATCTLPSSTNEQSYLFFNFSQLNYCINYTLPSISDAFCSVYVNTTSSTIPPPTYLSTTTTILTTTILTATTIINENGTTTISGGGGGNAVSNNDAINKNNSSSPSWYIILGIVLGLVLLVSLIILGIFLCRDRLLPGKFRSRLQNNDNEPIIRHSESSSQTTFQLNGIKPNRASMSTSDQDDGILQFDDDGITSLSDKIHPEQETQTCFQVNRSKPTGGQQPRITRDRRRITTNNDNNNTLENPCVERKKSSSTATTDNVATNTANVVKGIPISSVPTKLPPLFPNGNSILSETNTSELNVTSIPLAPSRRAKPLPQIKGGIYSDSTNTNLLNTSASAIITNQRQRRLSPIWTHEQNQNVTTPLPARPQSMTTPKTNFDEDDDSSGDEACSIPTVESLPNKSSKPMRTVPLLNITVVPAWINDNNDKK